ncbi:MAG: DUF4157 domain-containing protein [Reichenbachiella sp.]|uniref:DUF4157 domain-containing protein n=1 Tax=Reichenbachiella sp. TaxID=2184521 RepID=UPI0029670002|nr:DUF4157 domain-containing protein [Reichenbachiella sp.]MDW3210031.1 DUF4157 domain-containing protein [Reichenbachiella sp.]
MKTHAIKNQEGKKTIAESVTKSKKIARGTFQFVDKRPETHQLKKIQELANNNPSPTYPIQKKRNNTGLPDNLKSGIESLSGYSMNDVKVNYNSAKPAQLNAHAYAQGTEIHLASGQEKHLPHEAWHVVQQKQGRVKPTLQMKGKVNVNDDVGLEKEADVMGAKAIQMNFINPVKEKIVANGVVQRKVDWHQNSNTLNNSNSVVQRTPSSLRVNKEWSAPSGYIKNPAKQLKESLEAYASIRTDANLDERTVKLNIVEGEINNFRRNHPVNQIEPGSVVMKVMAHLGTLERMIAEERAQIAQSRDAQTGGHPQVRHGADLSDLALIDRLIRQQDRADDNATSDTSSRFDNDVQMNDSMTDATTELNNARLATDAAFTPLIAAHTASWNALIPTGGTPGFNAAKKVVNTTYKNLKAEKTNNNHLATAAGGGTRIPIKLYNELNFAAMNAAPLGIPTAVNNLVKSTQRGYAIKNPQKAPFGRAFELTANAKAALAAAKAAAKAAGKPLDPLWHTRGGELPAQAAAQPQATLTVRRPGIMDVTALPPATGWQLITHYPIPAIAGKEITG